MDILAIDDSKVIRNMLSNVLTGAGHSVTIAQDGQEGSDLAKTKKFDLVITDINMPEINGLDLAKHLRATEEYKSTPIVFLTTESSEEFKSRGRQIKDTTWITKPFSPTSILTMLDSIFNKAKMNVLAVDDSRSIRNMVNNVLSGAGHKVTLANDGKEAMDYANSTQFDLIITDVNMPEMDGFQLAKLLRSSDQHASTPIIFLTTETSEAFKAKGNEITSSNWITKPFSPISLLNIITAA